MSRRTKKHSSLSLQSLLDDFSTSPWQLSKALGGDRLFDVPLFGLPDFAADDLPADDGDRCLGDGVRLPDCGKPSGRGSGECGSERGTTASLLGPIEEAEAAEEEEEDGEVEETATREAPRDDEEAD